MTDALSKLSYIVMKSESRSETSTGVLHMAFTSLTRIVATGIRKEFFGVGVFLLGFREGFGSGAISLVFLFIWLIRDIRSIGERALKVECA